MSKKGTIIAVDFDGTLCKSNWPGIGDPNSLLIETLKHYQRHGCFLILWTCRENKYLDEAVKWCADQGLIFNAVNENAYWIEDSLGHTRKIIADVYIDDKAADIGYEKAEGWKTKYKWIPEIVIQDKLNEVIKKQN